MALTVCLLVHLAKYLDCVKWIASAKQLSLSLTGKSLAWQILIQIL